MQGSARSFGWKSLFLIALALCAALPASAQYHSADTNRDYAINLGELLRVIQFFNSDGLHCQEGSEDGYAPGPGSDKGLLPLVYGHGMSNLATAKDTCFPHDSDYNPQDWHINLSELLRIIQFFNSGGYHTQCDSEDSFALGTGSHETCGGEGGIEGSIEGQSEGGIEGQIEGQSEGAVEGQPEGMVEGEGQSEGEGSIVLDLVTVSGASTDLAYVMQNDIGERIIVLSDKTAEGLVMAITGGGYMNAYGESLFFWFGPDGLPKSLVCGEWRFTFNNYTTNTVEITSISPQGVIEIFQGVPVDAAQLAQLRALALTVKSFTKSLGMSDALNEVGLGLSVAGCAVGIGAISTGTGAALAATACTSPAIQIATLISDGDLTGGTGMFINTFSCALSTGSGNPLECSGMALDITSEALESAKTVNGVGGVVTVSINLLDQSSYHQAIDGFGGALAMWGSNLDADALQLVTQDLGTSIIRLHADGTYPGATHPFRKDPVSQKYFWQEDASVEWTQNSASAITAAQTKDVDTFVLCFWYPPDDFLDAQRYWNKDYTTVWADGMAQRISKFGTALWAVNANAKIFVSPQNEPNAILEPDPEGEGEGERNGEAMWAYWSPNEMKLFIPILRASINSLIKDTGKQTQVLILAPELTGAQPYDTSVNVEGEDGGECENVPKWNDNTALSKFVSCPEIKDNIYAFNYHLYDSYEEGTTDPGFPELSWRLFALPGTFGFSAKSWMTETSGAQWNSAVYHTLGWHDNMTDMDKALAAAQYIHRTLVDAGSSAFLWWGLTWVYPEDAILDQYNEPDRAHLSEKFWDEGLVIIDNDTGKIHDPDGITKKYYAFKQYSKYVRPGFQRVDAIHNSSLLVSAFYSVLPNVLALVVVNSNPTPTRIEPHFTALSPKCILTKYVVTDTTRNAAEEPVTSWNSTISGDSVTTLVYEEPPDQGEGEGEALEPLDIAFVLDTTYSMINDIAAVKAAVNVLFELIQQHSTDFRIALIDYKDFPGYGGINGDYAFRTLTPFTSDLAAVSTAVNSLAVHGGGDKCESLYSAIMHAMTHSEVGGWRSTGLRKALVFVSDAPPHDPELTGDWKGYTAGDVALAANEGGVAIGTAGRVNTSKPDVNGIRLFPVLLRGNLDARQYFQRLAAGTNGRLIEASDTTQLVAAIEQAILYATGVSVPVLSVTPFQRNVAATAESTSFAVSNTGTGTMSWTASLTSGSSWMWITSGSTGTNGGTITVSYDSNTSASSRTGTIQVTASGATGSPSTVNVIQSGSTPVPTVTSFSINNGATSTSSRTIALNNTCTGSPTHYMASESSSFSGAAWQTYAAAPSFVISSGNGVKTVYFKARSSAGESAILSDAIVLSEGGDEETILLPGDAPLTMVWIPGGTFMMGRYSGEQYSYSYEDPQHSVTVQGFWMGKYELTKAQWTAVMGTTPWSGQSYVLDDPDSPAVYVSWNDAQSFLTVLNTYTGLRFRLPSESEWEYACRAGTTTRFYWGDDPSNTVGNDYCWWYYNAYGIGESYAHVVGLKLPNLFGLYDMSGNVVELCEDDWHYDYTGAPEDGTFWVDSPRGSARVGRGGDWYGWFGWFGRGDYCRSAYRYSFNFYPSFTHYSIGFRLSR